MYRSALSVVLVVVASLIPLAVQAGDHPQVVSPGDSLDTFAADVAALEADYAALAGKYAQILPSGAPPADGAKIAPDTTTTSTDGVSLEVWAITPPDDLAIAVDEYRGPSGIGYLVCGEKISGGVLYRRCQHIGFDPAFASFDWTAVEDEP